MQWLCSLVQQCLFHVMIQQQERIASTSNQSTKELSKTRTDSNPMAVTMGIFLCSLLPFLHDIITTETGKPKAWVPDLGIVDFLTMADGKVWGYSSYGVFLYLGGLQCTLFLGWLLALHFARNRSYRFALYFPTILFGYQFLLVVFNLRQTQLNDLDYKIILTLVLGIVLTLNFFLNKKNAGTIKESKRGQ